MKKITLPIFLLSILFSSQYSLPLWGMTNEFGLAYGTKYYARIKPDLSTSYGRNTAFTAPLNVTSPANGATNTDIALTITSTTVIGATTYTIDLSTNNFATVAFTGSGSNSQSFSGLAYDTKYYARVKTDLSANYGKTTTFTTAPLNVISPANGAMNTDIALTIASTTVTGASTYTIELSTNNFATVAFTHSGSNTQSFSGLAYGTKYYARVKTNLSASYGKTATFTTVPLYVTSPANGATSTSTSLTIASTTVIGAATYTIELSTNNFATVAFTHSGSNTQGFSGLASGTKYYARVKTNLSTNYGETTSFTTLASLFYIISPSNATVNVPYVTNVTVAAGATQYTIELNTDPSFATGVSIIKTMASRTIGFTLSYDTRYYARFYTDVNPNNWSTSVRSFTTGNPLSLAYVASPINSGTGVPTTVTVYSNPVPTATSYTIELNTDPLFQTGVSILRTSTKRSISFSGLAFSQVYYARVHTNLDGGQWGTTNTHFTTACSSCRSSDDWVGETGEEAAVEFGPSEASIYPIPFRDKLTIHVQTDQQEEMYIQLYDLNGMDAGRMTGMTNSLIDFNSNNLSSGMYLLKMATSKGVIVKKVIKE